MCPSSLRVTWSCNSSMSDWWPRGCWFDSRPVHCQLGEQVARVVTSGQVVHTHVPLFTMQYNLVPVVKGRWLSAAGKVTVGLASHWPCVTDSVVYPPSGLTAIEMEMNTSLCPFGGVAPSPSPYIRLICGGSEWVSKSVISGAMWWYTVLRQTSSCCWQLVVIVKCSV